MFKKIFNIFLDYVAYVILAMFGLFIVKFLYLMSLTDIGSIIIILITISASIIWSFYRLFNSKRK